jgi:hypothetical protein
MTMFQTLSLILSAIGLFAGIVFVYVRTQVDITKINTSIMFLEKDLDRKELSICRLETENKLDHEKIMKKIDTLIERNNGE